MRETMAQQTHDVVVDQTPLHVYMGMILDRLRAETRLPFAALFTPPHTRGRLVGLFLGVLELTKQRRIVPEQGEPFTDIWVSLAPDGARRNGGFAAGSGKRLTANRRESWLEWQLE